MSQKTEELGHAVIPTDILNKILDFLPQLQSFNEMLLNDFTERISNWYGFSFQFAFLMYGFMIGRLSAFVFVLCFYITVNFLGAR